MKEINKRFSYQSFQRARTILDEKNSKYPFFDESVETATKERLSVISGGKPDKISKETLRAFRAAQRYVADPEVPNCRGKDVVVEELTNLATAGGRLNPEDFQLTTQQVDYSFEGHVKKQGGGRVIRWGAVTGYLEKGEREAKIIDKKVILYADLVNAVTGGGLRR